VVRHGLHTISLTKPAGASAELPNCLRERREYIAPGLDIKGF
jgi:hypothetical protein